MNLGDELLLIVSVGMMNTKKSEKHTIMKNGKTVFLRVAMFLVMTVMGVNAWAGEEIHNGKTYNVVYLKSGATGNGDSQESPVGTWAAAYAKLSKTGGSYEDDWNRNIIVVIGNMALSITESDTNGGVPATITGVWPWEDNDGNNLVTTSAITGGGKLDVAYTSARGQRIGADTRFRNVYIHSDGTKQGRLCLFLHNTMFDTGCVMGEFATLATNMGAMSTTDHKAPDFHLMCYSDEHDFTTNGEWNQTAPMTLTIKSGRFGRIMSSRIAGTTAALVSNRYVIGKPEQPLMAKVVVDIDSSNDAAGYNPQGFKDDIAFLCAGLTQGVAYADVQFDIKRGKIATIVAGSQGNAIAACETVGVPTSSYFGRTVTNVMGATDADVTIYRYFGACLGRFIGAASGECSAYFYGQSILNLVHGTIEQNVFASAGGLSGLKNPNPSYTGEDQHTTDKRIPYLGGVSGYPFNGINYTSYDASKTIAKVISKLNGTQETIDLAETKIVTNISGGLIKGNVYGGSYGYSSEMKVESAPKGAGSLWGNPEINISGGEIRGNVYGGGGGASAYYNLASDANKSKFLTVATVYGNTNVTITGKPVIQGVIYGGGAGLAYQAQGSTETINVNGVNQTVTCTACEFVEAAKVYGSTRVVINTDDDWEHASNIYGGGALGAIEGETNIIINGGIIDGDVFGAGLGEIGHPDKAKVIGNTNVAVSNASTSIEGSVFGGGSNGSITGTAAVSILDAKVGGSVYGAGLGSSTIVGANTLVSITGVAKVNGNVYGGGDAGDVEGTASVRLEGGSLRVNNVFGAGKGPDSNVGTGTSINIVSGTVMGSVFGGAEEGTVNLGGTPNAYNATVVTLHNGLVKGNLYGGGKLGTVAGRTVVNMEGGTIEGKLFGGALGERDGIYVAGLKTVNMTGGAVIGDVYGGSQQANDANVLSNPNDDETASTVFVNISGGRVVKNVYAGGFYGKIFGSVTLNVGKYAIENAPDHDANINELSDIPVYPVKLEGSLYAGSDWGEFNAGEDFGANNISGRSDIYIDGTGYNTDSGLVGDYMVVAGSVFGAGTSSDAGKAGRRIYIRNYGHPIGGGNDFSGCTRLLYSIQRGTDVYLENTHITFIGQGDMTSFITTERYAIVNVDDLRLINGSSLDTNSPVHKLKKLQSLSLSGSTIYNATSYDEVTLASLPTSQNKFRINDGGYLNVKYPVYEEDPYNVGSTIITGWLYGELKGYFYMVTSAHSSFAFARPKNAVSSSCPSIYDNASDGGFASYLPERNTYSESGQLVETGGVQVPFSNHTPNSKEDVPFYRFWGFMEPGDNYREGVFVAKSDGSENKHYQVATCQVEMPAATGCYFKVRSIDWGMDVACIDAAINVANDNKWSYWNDEEHDEYPAHTLYEGLDTVNGVGSQIPAWLRLIDAAPNTVFGLAVAPSGSLRPGIVEMSGDVESGTKSALVISGNTSTEHLATRRFVVDTENLTETPKLTFMLTYSNELDRNTVLSSIAIVVDEYDCDNDELLTSTIVELVVNTETVIDEDFVIPGYALMYGKGENGDVYNAKVVLPTFQLYEPGHPSTFKVTNVVTDLKEPVTGNQMNLHPTSWFDTNVGTVNDIAVEYGAALTYDNVQGWLTGYDFDHPELSIHDAYDFVPGTPVELGTVDGRKHFGIALNLHYNGHISISPKDYHLGTITFTIEFDNYQDDQPSAFDIVFDITERGAAINWYVDGVDGSNLYSGKYPNKAKRSLSGVFNSSTFAPSDNIFIVNTVTVKDTHGTEWNGLQYGNSNVQVYRYPGGHEEEENVTGEDVLPQFTGPLVSVERDFIMRGISLDGMNEWDGVYHELLNPDYYHTLGEGQHGMTVSPSASLVEINNGAKVSLYRSSLDNNRNDFGNGGGIKITDGILSLNDGCNITGNSVNDGCEGGGIYLENGTINVSGEIRIEGNTSNGKANNVYLSRADQKINIDYQNGGLTGDSHIGVTKVAFPAGSAFTPIAFSETVDQAAEAYRRGYFFDDKGMYVVIYNPTNPVLGPNTLYFAQTWVTRINERPEGFDPNAIDSREDLAWVVSLVNGLNGEEPQPDLNVTVTEDLDMSGYIWIPIGNSTNKFEGVFDGGGHQINGLVCSMSGLGAVGLLGYVDGEDAEVKNVFVMDASVEAPDKNYMGSIAGVVSGGATVCSCEGALELLTGNESTVMGGLVGLLDGGNIHSCISTADLNGYLMGGLVGQTRNGATVKNCYAYAGFTYLGEGGHHISGMVADNEGTVENCYIRLRDSYDMNGDKNVLYFLVGRNNGSLSNCYYPDGVDEDYLYHTGNALSNCNKYFPGTHPYTYHENYNRVGNETNGDYLLSILNDYASANNMNTWFRTASALNEDLPLLRFPDLASAVNVQGSPKFYYFNSLQTAFDKFGSESAHDVYVDVYGNSDVVTTSSNTGASRIRLTINEDAAVLQDESSDLIASVGITLDNSAGSNGASPTQGGTDAIDWHMFSTSLQNVPTGINYTDNDLHEWYVDEPDHPNYVFFPDDNANAGYYPGNTPFDKYDFYCYFEPAYHWINFRRNGISHWHEDETEGEPGKHEWISYGYTRKGVYQSAGLDVNHINASFTNEPELIQGKGYMLSVNDETFLQAAGMLNNGVVTYVDVTANSDKCRGLNLIGNPYQSYLDFKAFAEENSGSGKIWPDKTQASYTLIDEDMKGYVTYHYDASWNEGGITASRYVNMHQGFFVTTQGNAIATFNNGMRNAYGYHTTFRGEEEMPHYPLVNLILSERSGICDYAVVELNRPEAGGARKVKSLKLGKGQIYAHYADEDYALAFVKSGETSVPVRFTTSENGTFALGWNTQNATFGYLHLIDNLTGVDVDCLATDRYVFTATPDDYESRFKLVFQFTGVDENADVEPAQQFAFFHGDNLVVNGEGRLECLDLQGRVVFATDIYGPQSLVSLPKFAAGMYLLQLHGGKQTAVQKIIVK